MDEAELIERGRRFRAQRRALEALGVPEWAHVGSGDSEHLDPVLFVWVEEDGIHSIFVGEPDQAALERLAAQCSDAGLARAGISSEAEMSTPAALVVVHVDGVGNGSLDRAVTKPLGDLIARARDELA